MRDRPIKYWWVNQNQTYHHEVTGGYIWSPKRNRNGNRNPFYDFMREVSLGDVIFSFADTQIKAIGISASTCYEAPKPLEFKETGAYWDQIGWRVDVRFSQLRLAIRPSDHMETLRPLLPSKYAPLQMNGSGLQGVYLTLLPEALAGVLVDLIGAEAHALVRSYIAAQEIDLQQAIGLVEWEEHELDIVRSNPLVPETEKQAIILARRGQGTFKARVMKRERSCRITGVTNPEHLRASHSKPWRDATNAERLDGENGLLLTPSIDHLFDRGFIGFDKNGDLLISRVADVDSMNRMGVDTSHLINVGGFTENQAKFIEYHRECVLLKSRFME